MQKTLLALALVASASFTSAVNATNGTINFSGTIINSTCTVDTADASQNVQLGMVNKSSFIAAGDEALAKPFSIRLSNCQAPAQGLPTSVYAYFGGDNDAVNHKLLANTGGTAVGVGIGIYEHDLNTIIPVGGQSQPVIISTDGKAELKFVAKYIATAANAGITAGSVQSVSQFSIAYN